MPITDQQLHLLKNLGEITTHRKLSGWRGYFLAGEECTATVNSLIEIGLVRQSADQKRLRQTGVMPSEV